MAKAVRLQAPHGAAVVDRRYNSKLTHYRAEPNLDPEV